MTKKFLFAVGVILVGVLAIFCVSPFYGTARIETGWHKNVGVAATTFISSHYYAECIGARGDAELRYGFNRHLQVNGRIGVGAGYSQPPTEPPGGPGNVSLLMSGIGFQGKPQSIPLTTISQNKGRLQLPGYSPNLSIQLNQEEADVPETQPSSGCFLINWGVPPWAVQSSAAFVGGHLFPWAVFGTVGLVTSGFEPYALLAPPLLLFSDFDGSYWFQKAYLVTWYYLGVPIGATLTTMGTGVLLHPGGNWAETIRGALIGDMASLFLAVGYYIVFGNPWAYSPEGGHPTWKTIGPFVSIFLPIASTLPTAGAVIGYNKSLDDVNLNNMGYERSWTQSRREDFINAWGDQQPHLELTLLRVSF